MDLLLRLVVGHLIGDFILQTNKISKEKSENLKYLLIHIFIVFISLLICTLNYFSMKLIYCLVIISLLHVIDYLKKFLNESLLLFFLDQIIHLMSLILVPILFGFLEFSILFDIISKGYFEINLWIYVGGYAFGLFAGRVIIQKLMFRLLSLKSNEISAYIGIVERLIVITLALFDAYTAIGIIFAIKGVARKKFVEGDEKNGEYYFLGTGMSFFIAIISALAIKFLLNAVK